MNSPEPSLLNALRYRDRTAMREAIRSNHGFLIALVVPLVGMQLAENVALDTWMQTLAALDRFERRGKLRTWLAQIALNAARSAPRPATHGTEWGADPGSPVAEKFDERGRWSAPPTYWDKSSVDLLTDTVLRSCIEKQLARLPADQQAVLRLRDLEFMDLEEIAITTQLTQGEVCVLLHRARQALHATIERFRNLGSC
jgi:RNA polymerase sigma-70 factor, ECF subfamily